MRPEALHAETFSRYPQQARVVVTENLPLLRRMPAVLLPLILRQLIDYDWLFPAEQHELMATFKWLGALAPNDFDALMAPFAAVPVPAELRDSDWVNQPGDFAQQLSAFLWSQHRIDDFHRAFYAYDQRREAAVSAETPITARYTFVVVGDGVKETSLSLYRRLRPHGTLFTAIDPAGGLQTLLDAVKKRAQSYPAAYAHWYIDGGEPEANPGAGVQVISYGGLAPAIRKELAILNQDVLHPPQQAPSNPEGTVSAMEDLKPKELGMTGDDVLQRFALAVLTQGSGTQVYSTSFVQWTARECLHRAQPLTVLARFRPRQQAATMNELLARDPFAQVTDPEGSLVDADMGAYLTWINQSRLTGADQSRFLAWFEGHGTAIAIGPSMARGASSSTPATLEKILDWIA